MRNMGKMRKLILDLQHDLAVWIVPDSGISDKEVLNQLFERLDGPQAREALAEDDTKNKNGLFVSASIINVAVCALTGFVCWITKSPWGLIAFFAMVSARDTDDDEEKEND